MVTCRTQRPAPGGGDLCPVEFSPQPSTATRPAAAPRPGVPAAAPDEVVRGALLERLRAAAATTDLVVVTAPAGYGKTTLLAQMARAAALPVAWVTLDPSHSAPRRLAAEIEEARSRVAPGPGEAFLLVLDNGDVLASRAARAAIEALVNDLPPGGRLALGCRADPGLLLGRRLVEGGLVQITAADLAFDAQEAQALLAAAGVELDPDALATIVERTEGWPAGIRLAAMRLAGHEDPSEAARAFAGDDRTVADYLHEVMLADLSPETIDFLTRTSILEPMSGDLCDAALGTTGSGMRLHELERSNLLLVALDDRGEHYRYHRLLGEMLRRELSRREPDARAPAAQPRQPVARGGGRRGGGRPPRPRGRRDRPRGGGRSGAPSPAP